LAQDLINLEAEEIQRGGGDGGMVVELRWRCEARDGGVVEVRVLIF
jgi:hypothetical protein